MTSDSLYMQKFVEAFIQRNARYYMRVFYGKLKPTDYINFGALFGGPIWLFYRKMYLFGFCLSLYQLCEFLFFRSVNPFSDSTAQVNVQLFARAFESIMLAVFANTIYKKHVMKKVTIDSIKITESQQFYKAAKYGGTNIPLALIAFAIKYLAEPVLMVYLAYLLYQMQS